MTAKIIRKYFWNNKEYCNIQYGDGTCITLRGEIGQYVDEEWVALALELYEAQAAEPDPLLSLVMSAPDQMIIDEIIRRHLELAVDGGVA